jgi:hypothetical protein
MILFIIKSRYLIINIGIDMRICQSSNGDDEYVPLWVQPGDDIYCPIVEIGNKSLSKGRIPSLFCSCEKNMCRTNLVLVKKLVQIL